MAEVSAFILLNIWNLKIARIQPLLMIALNHCLLKSLDRRKKNIVISAIYRLPDRNLNEFIGELDQLLSRISKENKLVYLLSDWNINLLCHLNHHATGEFLELMYSKTFFPLITRPTRITEHMQGFSDRQHFYK